MYPVDISDNGVAVVRMYRDRVICVHYNPNDKRIQSYFVRSNIGNEYREEKIGPLISPTQNK